MAQLVHTFEDHVSRGDSAPYAVQAWGEQRSDGMWEGWLVFHAHDGRASLRTDRETVQGSLQALTYWAAGLEPASVNAALGRAHQIRPEDNREADSDNPAA